MKKLLVTLNLCFIMLTSASCALAQDNPASTAYEQQEHVSDDTANYDIGTSGEAIEDQSNVNVGHIYRACKNYFDHTFNTRENAARKAICNGFFYGMGGTLMTLGLSKVDTGVCLPKNFSTEQFIRDFISWVKSDASNKILPAAGGTMKMLTEKYPCF